MTKIGLKSVWEKFDIDFTHMQTDFKSTSVLDHFLMNESLLDRVEAACPIHLGDNLSRHSPIMLQLRIPEIQLKTKKENMTYLRTPSWYKASYGQKIYYKNLLAERLGQLNNSEALCCTDITCSDETHSKVRYEIVLDTQCTIKEVTH